jgi:hypothetical protein
MDWARLDLTGDPILVVGLRGTGDRLESYRVTLDRNVHPELRRVVDETIERISGMDPVEYTPYVEPQADEYLTLDASSLVLTIETADEDGVRTRRQQTAELAALVQRADVLPELGAGQLIERLDKFRVQAICLRAGTDLVGFVTKATARQVMKRSAIPLGKDDSNDRFKRLSRPEVVLEGDVHAIVMPSEVAILNKAQFQFLVGDVGLVAQYAPAQVKRIASRLKARGIPLSAATTAAIEAKAIASVQVAKRLDAFAERVEQIDVTLIANGGGFRAQELQPDDFVNADGEIECDTDRVVELLDALEGRFFGDAFSPEKRRADSFRRR